MISSSSSVSDLAVIASQAILSKMNDLTRKLKLPVQCGSLSNIAMLESNHREDMQQVSVHHNIVQDVLDRGRAIAARPDADATLVGDVERGLKTAASDLDVAAAARKCDLEDVRSFLEFSRDVSEVLA